MRARSPIDQERNEPITQDHSRISELPCELDTIQTFSTTYTNIAQPNTAARRVVHDVSQVGRTRRPRHEPRFDQTIDPKPAWSRRRFLRGIGPDDLHIARGPDGDQYVSRPTPRMLASRARSDAKPPFEIGRSSLDVGGREHDVVDPSDDLADPQHVAHPSWATRS